MIEEHVLVENVFECVHARQKDFIELFIRESIRVLEGRNSVVRSVLGQVYSVYCALRISSRYLGRRRGTVALPTSLLTTVVKPSFIACRADGSSTNTRDT